ncbi:hypothetical protein H632_c118p0 [Helicosporidium sp. ATCC 50920]|nr:hypothetical protein H632_c118p0 [Helicosporidium sp. ATCC 50920]|eukprot:KDD76749.1 hypothetical protein H632_c118p0 [Helicosporidium sp. ATCC 50920]
MEEPLFELKVGRMFLRDNRLEADTRRGCLRYLLDVEEGLSKLEWSERDSSAEPTWSTVIFPAEAVLEKIPRPGARIFVLKFPAERDRDQFFWAQDPDPGSDDSSLVALNSLLTAGPAAAGGDSSDGEDVRAGGAGGSATTAQALAQALAAALQGSGGAKAGGQTDASTLANLAQMRAQHAPLSLSKVLDPQALTPLLSGSEALVKAVADHLPESQQARDKVLALVGTPQWRHQVAVLSHALNTGQLDASQFGVAANGPGVLALLEALCKEAGDEPEGERNAES